MKRWILSISVIVFGLAQMSFAEHKPLLHKPIENLTKRLIKSIGERGDEVVFLPPLLSNVSKKPSTLGDYMTDRLRTELANNGITVISRSALQIALEENKLAYSGLLDESTVVRLGKALGSSIVLQGTISESRKEVHFNILVNDIEMGYTLGGVTYSIKKNKAFREIIRAFPDGLPDANSSVSVTTIRHRQPDGTYRTESEVTYETR